MKRILALLTVLALLPAAVSAELEVHFPDVGQGDCAVVLCDGEAMVIDGGPRDASGYVYSYIRGTLRLRHIDCIVSTHPHADHVYGLTAVLNAAPADLLLTPVTEWDSKCFRKMTETARKQGTQILVPAEGDTLRLGGAEVTVLCCWPEAVGYGRVNDASIVLRIDYGGTRFLFMGDAEEWTENSLLDAGADLRADVLKVAHHGSRYSTSAAFLEAVSPAWAVITAGAGNEFGHPHAETLERLAARGCTVLRTDTDGAVVLISDGAGIRAKDEKTAPAAARGR